MRTLYSPLTASLFSLSMVHGYAQPALGPGALNPLPGESYTVYFCDYINPGFGGPDQTWDFTNIVCTVEPPGTYEDPAGNPWFPSASVVFDDVFLEGNSTALIELGFAAPGPDIMTCTDPLQLFMYPMTYGDQFVDNMDCDRTGVNPTTHRSGTATVTADGYGTVILPYGTFTDCLRIHEERTYTDQSETPPNTTNFQRQYFHFVRPGIKRPLVSVLETSWSMNGGPWSTGSSASMLIADLSTQVSPTQAEPLRITVRPNPMEEEAMIDVPGSPHAELHVMVTDALGRGVRTEAITALPYVLRRGDLMSGLYTCRVLAGTRIIAVGSIAVR
jgi:hypothetical protein